MNRTVFILEEDADDLYLTQETISRLGFDFPIKYFSESTAFFNSLHASKKPVLILVDYNSTPDNGIEVLKKLKSDPDLSEIPVVILSDCDHPRYKHECYRHGASSFIKKPDTIEATDKKIEAFFRYWFDVVEV